MEKPWFLKGNYLQMVGFPYLCQIIEEYVIGNSVNQFAECWNWNEVKHKLTKITERNENIWLFILKNMVPLNPLGNHHAHYQKNPQYNLVGIPHVSTKPYLTSSIIVKFLWTVAFSAPELTFFRGTLHRTCWMKIHGYVIEQYQLTWLKSGQSPGVLVELPEIYLCHYDPLCINRTSRICREGNSK